MLARRQTMKPAFNAGFFYRYWMRLEPRSPGKRKKLAAFAKVIKQGADTKKHTVSARVAVGFLG